MRNWRLGSHQRPKKSLRAQPSYNSLLTALKNDLIPVKAASFDSDISCILHYTYISLAGSNYYNFTTMQIPHFQHTIVRFNDKYQLYLDAKLHVRFHLYDHDGRGRLYTLSRYQWSWVTFLYASEYMRLYRVVFVICSCPRSQWSGPLKLEIMLGGCYVITVLKNKLR